MVVPPGTEVIPAQGRDLMVPGTEIIPSRQRRYYYEAEPALEGQQQLMLPPPGAVLQVQGQPDFVVDEDGNVRQAMPDDVVVGISEVEKFNVWKSAGIIFIVIGGLLLFSLCLALAGTLV